MLFLQNPGSNKPQNSNSITTYLSFPKPFKWDEEDMNETVG